MRKPLAALVGLAALAHAGSAAAAQIPLYAQDLHAEPPPPLLTRAAAPTGSTSVRPIESRLPGPVSSRERVDVGIGPDGRPVRVTAGQRLRIDGTGDYSFVVPAPATSVVPAPGSESRPGLRAAGIVWQGFSNRRRVLSATATLRPGDAAAGLPLRVLIERRGGAVVVRLSNLTRRRVQVTTGRVTSARLREALQKAEAYYRSPLDTGGVSFVDGAPGPTEPVDMAAPLRVTGVIGGEPPLNELLGGGRPLERTFVLRGTSAPKLELRVDLLPARELLPTPRALAGAARPLMTLQAALGAIEISAPFQRYLASPDELGPSRASYVYRTAKPAANVAAPQRRRGHTLSIVLALALAAAGVAGLAVVWARS